MKKIILSITLITLLSTSLIAKECEKDNLLGLGLVGVGQGFIIGGPVGAIWGAGTAIYAAANSKDSDCVETKAVETTPLKEEKVVENVDEKLNTIKSEENKASELNSKFVESFTNFDYDKYNIKKLNVDLDSLNLSKAKAIVIEGNTDQKGTDEYNFALGLKRANSVKTLLLSKGIEESKLKVVSFGETAPISTEDSKNRRVDLKINY